MYDKLNHIILILISCFVWSVKVVNSKGRPKTTKYILSCTPAATDSKSAQLILSAITVKSKRTHWEKYIAEDNYKYNLENVYVCTLREKKELAVSAVFRLTAVKKW